MGERRAVRLSRLLLLALHLKGSLSWRSKSGRGDPTPELGSKFSTPLVATTVMLVLTVLTPAIHSQTITTGEVTGNAIDPSGAVVANATVLLKSLDTGEPRTVQSNANGLYRFTLLKPGTYQISASSVGLKSDTGGLTVSVGQVQVVNLTLTLEASRQIVLVNEPAPLLSIDNANIVSTFSTTQIELLPSPGGDLTTIAFSVPGITVNTNYVGGNFTSYGLPSVSNLFTVNGADDMDPYYNVNNAGPSGLLLGMNEVREASVIQNAYEVQYGRQAGAQVNYVSKSGANEYRGNLLEAYNGSVMNANDFFANALGIPRSHGVSNQYAASLGGPIFRDKLFFFADTEGLRYALPSGATVVSVPSLAFQSYTLSTILPAQVPLYQKAFQQYDNAPGHDRAVPVIDGDGLLQDSNGALGCGALAGTPTGAGGTFGVNVSCADAFGTQIITQISEWLLSTRVDYNISARHMIFFRFKTDRGSQPFNPSLINPVFSGVSHRPDYEGQVNHTYVVTAHFVNNFIGSASYLNYLVGPPDLTAALQTFPFRFNITDGGANGTGGGMTPLGVALGLLPTGRRVGQLQLVDDVSYSLGNHSLKAGVNYRYERISDASNSPLTVGGRFVFRGLDELAAGEINPNSGSNYTQHFTQALVTHLRLYNLGLYAQDHWAVRPNVKLTVGIRFDRNGNPSCTDRCFARLALPWAALNKGANVPYNQSIQTGLANAFYQTDAVLPQPRFGIAYNPGWSKSTVVRGGIGLFADLYPVQFIESIFSNPPKVFTSVIHTGLVNMGGPGSAPAIASDTGKAFQSGFANGATLAQLQQAVAPATFAAPPFFSISSSLLNPMYLEWSFEVQHQFGAQNLLSLSYVGNHGYDIFLVNPYANANANPASYPNGFGGLPAAAPDPRFTVVSDLGNSAYSNYNGLTVAFQRALAHGFQGRIGYTWSHALDINSNGGLIPYAYDSIPGQNDAHNPRSLNYSNADYDIRHNLTADFVWEIPARSQNRLVTKILGGWSASGKLYAHSGFPFGVYNSSISGQLSPSSGGGTVLAALLDPKIRFSCGRSAVDTPCFTASEFATTATQTNFGNLPRNAFRGSGFFDLDLSLYKAIAIRERMRLTLGASAYNLLNHPNFAHPQNDVAFGGLGLITSTLSAPTGPYGFFTNSSARVLVVTGKFAF